MGSRRELSPHDTRACLDRLSPLLIRLGPLYSELQRLEQASKPQLGQTRGKGGDPPIRNPPRSLPH